MLNLLHTGSARKSNLDTNRKQRRLLMKLGVKRSCVRNLDNLRRACSSAIRVASAEEIPSLLSLTRELLPSSDVDYATARRVHEWNPETFLVVGGVGEPTGMAALLQINARGLDALLTGGFNFKQPLLRHLARAGAPPAGIYVWALCMRGRAVSALAAIMEWAKQGGRSEAHLYACPHTPGGLRFSRRSGFRPIACGQSGLWRYERPCPDLFTQAA
jgi:hypothetical protein